MLKLGFYRIEFSNPKGRVSVDYHVSSVNPDKDEIILCTVPKTGTLDPNGYNLYSLNDFLHYSPICINYMRSPLWQILETS
jgi:hypothetical protein